MNRWTLLPALVVMSAAALARDPVVTDGDKYRVVLENERVRVLEYRDIPGAATHEHEHPAFVLVALSAFQRELTLPDGKVLARRFDAGDVMFSPAQAHTGHNVGSTPTRVIMVELKQPVAECAARGTASR